jgi:tetratricopeptide (TPR) repeat protein
MSNSYRAALSFIVLCLAAVLPSEMLAQSADAELNEGVAAYKQARYEEAIAHFRRSIALDPNKVVSHLYLAVAFAQEYIPGVDTPDNNQFARQAIDEFERVLTLDADPAQKVSSLKGIASLYFNMKLPYKSKEYHRKVLEIDPEDVESAYSIGVIDWTEAYQPRMEQRATLGLKPGEPLINKNECWLVRAKNEELVNEGIEMLTKALTVRQDYEDAMAYMNLMYRERADIQCGNKQGYDADTKAADKWVDVTMATRMAKEKAHRVEIPSYK